MYSILCASNLHVTDEMTILLIERINKLETEYIIKYNSHTEIELIKKIKNYIIQELNKEKSDISL
jgi:hypothetical protein